MVVEIRDLLMAALKTTLLQSTHPPKPVQQFFHKLTKTKILSVNNWLQMNNFKNPQKNLSPGSHGAIVI